METVRSNRVHFLADICGLILLGAWFIASISAAWVGAADLFQRLGSFGVASVVAYFASVKLVAGSPSPSGYQDMLHAQRKHFMMLGQNVAYALQNTALLAAAVKQDSEKRGEPINKVAVALASSVEEVPEVPASSSYTDDMISISNELIDQAAEADQLVKRVNSNNELVQALVGVVSTLQWGFGDLFVCWFNGFGWKVCY